MIMSFFTTALPYIAAGGVCILLVWNIVLEIRLRRLARGSSGKNLESHIAHIARDYETFDAFRDEIRATLTALDARTSTSMRGVGLVKFNPFAGSGASKPSFAVAFVSEQGDGIVMSTLNARESISIFSKTLTQFKSEHELTKEENEALEKAQKSLHTL